MVEFWRSDLIETVQKSNALSPTQAQESAKSSRKIYLLRSIPVKVKAQVWDLQLFTGYLRVIRVRSHFLQRKIRELHLQYVYRLRQINTGSGESLVVGAYGNTPLQNIFVVARSVNNETIPMNPPHPL